MKKMNLSNSKKSERVMGLATLSNDEMRNTYGGASLYFVHTIKDGKIYWSVVIK
jgi:hypothetical protein